MSRRLKRIQSNVLSIIKRKDVPQSVVDGAPIASAKRARELVVCLRRMTPYLSSICDLFIHRMCPSPHFKGITKGVEVSCDTSESMTPRRKTTSVPSSTGSAQYKSGVSEKFSLVRFKPCLNFRSSPNFLTRATRPNPGRPVRIRESGSTAMDDRYSSSDTSRAERAVDRASACEYA